jgi:hypothetical protein
VYPEFALNSDGSIGNGVADVGLGLLSRTSSNRKDAFDRFRQPLPCSNGTHEKLPRAPYEYGEGRTATDLARVGSPGRLTFVAIETRRKQLQEHDG